MKCEMQLPLPLDIGLHEEEWTFSGHNTRSLTHCYHDYPARMIPQVAGKLIDTFGSGAKFIFDPYCGSGTTLVESMIRGIHSAGTDLNPLARLISLSKTSLLSQKNLRKCIAAYDKLAHGFSERTTIASISTLAGISRLDFWYKPEVIKKLSLLKNFINEIDDDSIKRFFQVAFAETARECSNTRSDEFKLYRYDAHTLSQLNPDVFSVMKSKLERNFQGYAEFAVIMKHVSKKVKAMVFDFNTVDGIPHSAMRPASIDIVVTSPPYGDSHTTVAYGQYSRLASAWLELPEPQSIDRRLMGGRIHRNIPEFPSHELNSSIKKIAEEHVTRAYEVATFYTELYKSIEHVASLVRPNGFVCYVVGNRKVKGVVLPTDIAVRSFFEECGLIYVATYIRGIPNKRMPVKNSPTNIAGKLEVTMNREYIVVLKNIKKIRYRKIMQCMR